MTMPHQSKAIVIGASAGGMKFIHNILTQLPADFSMPIIIVQHISDRSNGAWIEIMDDRCQLKVKEAEEKEKIETGKVYMAPANYHLLVEKDYTFTLTLDERVNFARPSIDVLFETAAEAYGEDLIGIVGTGGNHDGAQGLLTIKDRGGLTFVQDPESAEVQSMPLAAKKIARPAYVLSVDEIVAQLLKISGKLISQT